MNRYGEQAPVPVICEVDSRPGLQGPFDTGTETPVRQNPFGCIRNQDGVADNGITVTDFFDGQVVRQVAWTDDFNSIVNNKKTVNPF